MGLLDICYGSGCPFRLGFVFCSKIRDNHKIDNDCLSCEHFIEFQKELKMSKKDEVTITKEGLDRAYRNGCPDVKQVLEDLFKGQHEFKKPIELKDGQIYRERESNDLYVLIEVDFDEWLFIQLPECSSSWSNIQNTQTTIADIKEYFTLCPNAKIKVVEDD